MFSIFKFNRRTLSVSVAAMTAAGTFTPINLLTSPVGAQSAVCNGSSGRPFSQAPAEFRNEGRDAANAATSPDVPLRVFNTERETLRSGGRNFAVTIFEFNGTQSNGCQLEVDVLRNPQTGQVVTQEIEFELRNRSFLPAVVNRRLDQAPLGSRFNEDLFERSFRPSGQPFGRNLPPLEPGTNFYEVEGVCTADIEFFGGENPDQACGPGEEFSRAEAVIREDGTLVLIEGAT